MDISLMFGLTLVTLIDILVAIGGFGSMVVAYVIWRVHSRQHKIQVLQNEIKIRSASAELSLKLLERWLRTKDIQFSIFADKMQSSSVDAGDPMIPRFLGALEEVAIFWKEGTIIDNHIKEFFGTELKAISKNEPVIRRLEEKRKEGVYANLWELYKKPEIWETR